MSRPGSTSAPCGSLAMVASRVAVAGIEPVEPAAITGPVPVARRLASAAISRSRRSAGSMRPFSFSTAGQYSRAILRNRSVFCQYSSMSVGDETVEPVPRHLPRHHVVHQPGEFAGEQQRRRRAVGDQREFAVDAHLRAGGPFQDQLRQQDLAFESADRLRQIERAARGLADRGFGEGQFVFVDVADRHDARQDRGVALRERRERSPAPAGRRAASADRSSRDASASGSAPGLKPRPRRSAINASISVGRNGADAGIVKTCGS